AITGVGGSERVLWMTTQQEPARIDVIPLFNRGQPRAHDLPEPIASITGHPRSDLVVCIGAETGGLYVVDPDRRARMRTLAPDGLDQVESAAIIVGRTIGVLAAQSGRPVALLALDIRDTGIEPMGTAAAFAAAASDTQASPSTDCDAAPSLAASP